MIRASILGATGYSGGELLRLLTEHPGVRLQHITSTSSVGRSVSEIHPHLRDIRPALFEKLKLSVIARDSDVAFSCFPHAVGLKSTARLLKAGVKVIDLSADFRFRSPSLFKSWYHVRHPAASLLRTRAYGLPEAFRTAIQRARLVANPGCYATAALLSLRPLLRPLAIDPRSVVVDAKSGVSGAGRKLADGYLFAELNENFYPYSIASHRHQPEMETIAVEMGAPKSLALTFTPHLVPMTRGILSVLYATLKSPFSTDVVHARFRKTYQHEPFVRVLPLGDVPKTKNVSHTNVCEIGVFQDRRLRRLVVVSALDNLVKGAAGQAVQNMNLMFQRPEIEGLR